MVFFISFHQCTVFHATVTVHTSGKIKSFVKLLKWRRWALIAINRPFFETCPNVWTFHFILTFISVFFFFCFIFHSRCVHTHVIFADLLGRFTFFFVKLILLDSILLATYMDIYTSISVNNAHTHFVEIHHNKFQFKKITFFSLLLFVCLFVVLFIIFHLFFSSVFHKKKKHSDFCCCCCCYCICTLLQFLAFNSFTIIYNDDFSFLFDDFKASVSFFHFIYFFVFLCFFAASLSSGNAWHMMIILIEGIKYEYDLFVASTHSHTHLPSHMKWKKWK